jgi:hypothetical protein
MCDMEGKYSPFTDRELMIRLLNLLDKDDEPVKKKKTKKQKIEPPIEKVEDPIKADVSKMLEKPKKRRKAKEEEEEYGEIDDKIENAIPETAPPVKKQEEFLEQEPNIKTTIKDAPIKEKPTPAKLFKEDLLMTIDPAERKKAIQSTKTDIVNAVSQPIKEEQAKQNINKFLSSYSKNKKY